ncbi:MAG TPA: hypothetical protein VGG16_30145 [Streptosporangiaceae bacterium]
MSISHIEGSAMIVNHADRRVRNPEIRASIGRIRFDDLQWERRRYRANPAY